MRKIIVLTFMSLDGVMQAPGGPDEDPTSDFKYGGWSFPYFDEFLGEVMGEQMGQPFDLLLGGRTYDIFASYWPDHPEEGAAINAAHKFVASRSQRDLPWGPSTLLTGDVAGQLRTLKQGDGPDLQVHGSSNFIQTLLAEDLVDELWLKIYPLTLGKGKHLFEEGTLPVGFNLIESKASPAGVIIANYRRGGEITTGSF